MLILSTDQDMTDIRRWLTGMHSHDRAGPWNNWNQIKRAHIDRKLRVVHRDGKAIAFYTHGEHLQPAGMLAVRPRYRRRGIAKEMVSEMIAWARANDFAMLAVEDLHSAFWSSMDFQRIDCGEGRSNRAYLRIPKPLVLPDHGQPVKLTVRFVAERSGKSLGNEAAAGKRLNDDSILLDRRIIGMIPQGADPMVSLEIDGELLIPETRARYLKRHGFAEKDGTFVLERITPPSQWSTT